VWLSSVNCKQRYKVEYKYVWRKQNFLSSFPTYSIPKHKYSVYVMVHKCAVHFSEEMLDRCKWNVNTSQALVWNFLLINNFATWFLVLQRFLLHFVCACFFFLGSVSQPSSQPPPPKKKQRCENLVLQRFLLHCVCVCVCICVCFLRWGGTGLWYWTNSQKKKMHTQWSKNHCSTRDQVANYIAIQIVY
jgi:hypothetical protein